MDAFEGLGDDSPDTEERRALRSPIARRAGAVFLSGKYDERHAFLPVADGSVIDRQFLAARLVPGHAALRAAHHQILDADVRERAAHHALVIPAPRTITVEVLFRDAVRQQILAGGRS